MKVVDRAVIAVGLSAFGALMLGLSLVAAMVKSPVFVLLAVVSTACLVCVGYQLGRLSDE